MKIYISHPNSFDFEEMLYAPLRLSALSQEHEFFLPHEQKRNINTKEEIQASDLLIAEVSLPSTGSGIEMGWASAARVPVWCVYRENSKPSGSLKYISEKMFSYKNSDDLVSLLEKELKTTG